ncbi:hypothetical protein ACPA2N_17925 [Ectopseudomonas hydrolytica]|uniref:hypothetical protein n=1 Tax=Ectopseudomonas hydrolytica TaxID=2493633 RepID=UPI003C2BB3CC
MEAAVQKKSFIKGTQPLWKAFWLLYVVSGFAFTIAAIIFIQIPAVNYALTRISEAFDLQMRTTLTFTATMLMAIHIIYFIFISISVWRCSNNSTNNLFIIAAKFIVLINFAFISYKAHIALDSLNTYFHGQ